MASQTAPRAPALKIPETEQSPISEHLGPVDSPATPSSQNALARFEFETGKGNEGTKILMVEWNPAAESNGSSTSTAENEQQNSDQGWEVSWEGKKTTFSLSEKDNQNATQRVYFLIPADVPIPASISISQPPPSGRSLSTKPMPAIFAPALGLDTKTDTGKRGVLHTIWAKKRLSQLQEEIRREMEVNSEGIGLEMVVQERQWIIDHFGLVDPDDAAASGPRPPPLVDVPPTPQSPRSPVGGRLGEKLRGLKLATSPTDLAPMISHNHHHLYSLSPDASDIAVPSCSAFSQATIASKINANAAGPGVASLNAIVDSKPGVGAGIPGNTGGGNKENDDEDFFALPMSPRSPEMKKSPFSFL
ncbi:uncharacterized protein BCR38DRAFT_339958 [Pseudomassariella vexata]|uniref:Uncharacterized protein n=1 Tax=Pseudomassariella vexata TaxID=1141098 RepID=A0A1Y2E4R0_9PEZI|nr:uncharacterized protein BCR38DRAFT_339958 [Pseudomassariella vexata]ORY66509.1 hypothetical protein BCR38DRAFT_339958 [Pseudomassariella vexata]